MKRIVLTGGGTAGHVTPNIALLPKLRERGYEIFYIGSYAGPEKALIEAEGVPYYGISSGKFRRYKDIKNITDVFRVLRGIFQAKKIIKELKPDVLFSKGGFVSVPVVLAAAARKVPIVIHESDMTSGLANRIAIPKARKVCCNFPETLSSLPADKGVVTGSPIRAELLSGSKEKACELTGLDPGKPILLETGGSSGAVAINEALRGALPELLKEYQIIHLCGRGNLDESLSAPGYYQQEYAADEMADFLAAADMVISRAGANTIVELLALLKPALLIPLPRSSSRGDQILNAESFERHGYSIVLRNEDMTPETLVEKVYELAAKKEECIEAMKKSPHVYAVGAIVKAIEEVQE